MRGLYLLELVHSPEDVDKRDIIEACRNLYAYAREHLSEGEVQAMGFDTIVFEHALCKLTRHQNAYNATLKRRCEETG